MGKKRKIKSYPQKYGRKFANHPYQKALNKLNKVVEKAEADGVVTAEEEVEIQAAAAVVEELAPDLNLSVEAVAEDNKPKEEPKPKTVPEVKAPNETPPPTPVAVEPPPPTPKAPKKPAKAAVKKPATRAPRKRTSKSKKDS